jgi:signal transduction histidine kinase
VDGETARSFEAIAKVVSLLGHRQDKTPVLEATLDAALAPLALKRGAVYLRLGESDQMELAASRGIPAAFVADGKHQRIAGHGTGLAGTAAHRGSAVVLIDLARESSAQSLVEAFRQVGVVVTSAAAVPVVIEGRPVGALLVVSEKQRQFTDSEVAYLALMGALLGWTLFSQRTLQELAKTNEQLDALTRALEQRTAELKELDRFKTNSIHLITHELRKPLSPIFTYSDMLLGLEFPPDKRRQFLENIRAAAAEMDGYVGQMIAAANIEEGGVQLVYGDADVGEVARLAVGRFQQTAADVGVSLDLALDLPATRFTTDGAKIGQVLENLIENAVKYTPQGGSVKVTVRRTGEGLQFAVSDTGIGIPAGEIPDLFNKYYVVANADVPRPAHRAGLGLYLAKVYAEAMGGAIAVESTQGKGSTFTLRMPAIPPPQQP